MNPLLDWQHDPRRHGYVNIRTQVFLHDNLLHRAGVWARVQAEQRNWGAQAAAMLTFRLLSELAESVVAAERNAGLEPCPCCAGVGSFRMRLMRVRCSVCNATGRFRCPEEVDR